MPSQPPPPSPPPALALSPAEPPPAPVGAELAPEAGEMRRERLPAWLISTIVHTAVLLVLALVQITADSERSLVLRVQTAAADAQRPDALTEISVAQDSPTAASASETALAPVPIDALRNLGETDPGEVILHPGESASLPHSQITVLTQPPARELVVLPLTGLDGRRPERRPQLVKQFGGTPESERAVEEALRWLAAHQQNNGGWVFDFEAPPCAGQCRNGPANPAGLPLPPTAATGLALLPFLGAGYTHHEGPYQEVVRRGLYYLRNKIRPATRGGDLRYGSMYGHGIAALALCEALAMTGDEDLRPAVRDVLIYIEAAQHQRGGWRYEPSEAGDMTVTGWQVMALKSGTLSGIPVNTLVRDRAEAFVASLSGDGGSRFGYRKPDEQPTCTAIGLLLRMYFGYRPTDPATRRGLYWLAELGPSETDMYFNYYATLTLHHARHAEWNRFNLHLRDALVASQATTGHERGSWHFDDHHGNVAGRLYTTALSALILEVYYRYLPLYGATGEFSL